MKLLVSVLLIALIVPAIFAQVQEFEPEDVSKLEQGEWFFEVYAPWCGFCKKLVPIFENASKQLKGKVQFAKLDGDKHATESIRFRVGGFPTIFHVKDGEIRLYDGPRTEEGFAQFSESKYKSVAPYPFYESPISPVGRALAMIAGYLIEGLNYYNDLVEKQGYNQYVLIGGFALGLVVISYIFMELVSWVFYLIFSVLFMIFGKKSAPAANTNASSASSAAKRPAKKTKKDD